MTNQTLTLSERELRVLEFAVWRFMHEAHDKHTYASMKKPNVDVVEEEKKAKAFLKDADDAKELLGKIRPLLKGENNER